MAHAYHAELGLPTTSVRPFNVYGPGQIGGGAIRAFIEAALAGRDLAIHGDGSQIRAWCYVDDMVDGALLALEHPNAVGESFNIGNARSAVTIHDLAQRVKRISGCPGEIVFQPVPYTDVELRIPNVEKARELLGFENLTRAPIDRRLMVPELLDADERAWLDNYHARVRADLIELLDPATADWLVRATAPLG